MKRRKQRAEAERAEAKLEDALERFKQASSTHQEVARSLVPPEVRVEDTGKFSVPPPPEKENPRHP